MAVAHVQSNSESSTTTSHTLVFGSAVSSGSLLLCCIRSAATLTITVSDNVNGAWTEIDSVYSNGTVRMRWFKFENSGAGSITVTVNTGVSATIRYAILEYSGAATSGAIQDFAKGEFTTTTTPASGTVTATGSGCMVVGAVSGNSDCTSIDARGGETERQEVDTRFQVQDESVAAGDHDSQWTFGTTQPGVYYVLVLAPNITTTKYLKLLAHSSAASATGVEGWVVDADNTTYYGKFTGAAFEASLESGEAVLKVAVTEFGGEALTTSDTPQVAIRNATYGTSMCDATVIEE